MTSPPADLAVRTFQFSTRCVRLVDGLPSGRAGDVIGRQLLRSATSVGANYRAARRARSRAEFIAKMGIVEEEADETAYWLDLIVSTELLSAKQVDALRQEANEIVAIVVASIRTAKAGRDTAGKS
jgi:four helix bundle protein